MDRDTLLELIPAYALDALDDTERLQVETFLQTDHEARQLLEEYRATAEALLLSVPMREAPSHLADDLMARVRAGRGRAGKDTPTTPSVVPPLPTADKTSRVYRVDWRIFASAAAVLVLVFLGFVLLSLSPQDENLALFERLETAENTRRIALTPANDDGVHGEILISENGEEAVIRVAALPQLSQDEVFELWLIGEEIQSGGTFEFRNGGDAVRYIPVPLTEPAESFQAFGVSIEPVGGSPLGNAPSGPRVFSVSL